MLTVLPATPIEIGGTISRTVNNLKDGKWYMWVIGPAAEGLNGDAFEDDYLQEITSENTVTVHFQNTSQNDNPLRSGFVDLRAFTLCKWYEQLGCISE